MGVTQGLSLGADPGQMGRHFSLPLLHPNEAKKQGSPLYREETSRYRKQAGAIGTRPGRITLTTRMPQAPKSIGTIP
jgi:hypothetical protein